MNDETKPFDRLVMRPGPGWEYLDSGVWEHSSKARIHVVGSLVKLPDGSYRSASEWPAHKDVAKLIRINGGSKKRGLMAWARILIGSIQRVAQKKI